MVTFLVVVTNITTETASFLNKNTWRMFILIWNQNNSIYSYKLEIFSSSWTSVTVIAIFFTSYLSLLYSNTCAVYSELYTFAIFSLLKCTTLAQPVTHWNKGTTTVQLLSFLCWQQQCCHCFNCEQFTYYKNH